MSQESERVEVEFDEKEKNIIEVTLGYLAQYEDNNDPEAAEEFREMSNLVRDEEPMFPLDLETIWVVLDRKQMIEFPSQPYDENKAAESAKETIEKVVDEIPEQFK